MSAQEAPAGLEGLSVMAAVLTAHQFAQGDHGCSCEEMFYDTRRTSAQIMHEHVLHVEMELLNAGIGPAAEAIAGAAAGLRGWYDERMSVTEGILDAALKITGGPALAPVREDS